MNTQQALTWVADYVRANGGVIVIHVGNLEITAAMVPGGPVHISF